MPPTAPAEPPQQPISHARSLTKPPSELPCFIGTSPNGILGFGVSPQRIAPIARDDRALVVGLLGAEGPRGLGMADRGVRLDRPPPLLVIKVCQNYIRSKNPEGPRIFYCFAR